MLGREEDPREVAGHRDRDGSLQGRGARRRDRWMAGRGDAHSHRWRLPYARGQIGVLGSPGQKQQKKMSADIVENPPSSRRNDGDREACEGNGLASAFPFFFLQ